MTLRNGLLAVGLLLLVALAYTFRPRDIGPWVLWEKRMTFQGNSESTEWEPIDGFARLADCHKAAGEIVQGALEFMRTGGRKLLAVRPDGRSAAYEEQEGATTQRIDMRYLCFPGAFDPRSPTK